MRQYILTDRDFEDFYNIMVACEVQVRAEPKGGLNPPDPSRTYRYHFIGWRNRVMSGNIPGRPMDYPTLDEPDWLKLRLKQLGLDDSTK